MTKVPLDTLLTQRGLANSRQKARALIMAGQVLVDGQVVDKPGTRIPEGAQVSVRAGLGYVGRGGVKLEHALERFRVEVAGKIAADVGASTGGFTDCLLQRGARRVYAIDVGYGQLAWRLRQDPRVVVYERTNIRYLEGLPEPVDLATIDVSFISLELVWPHLVKLLEPGAGILALVKPQFEAGREQVGRGGVVKDPQVHRQVLERVIQGAWKEGLRLRGVTASPLKGPAGNVEFFVYLSLGDEAASVEEQESIDNALAEAQALRP